MSRLQQIKSIIGIDDSLIGYYCTLTFAYDEFKPIKLIKDNIDKVIERNNILCEPSIGGLSDIGYEDELTFGISIYSTRPDIKYVEYKVDKMCKDIYIKLADKFTNLRFIDDYKYNLTMDYLSYIDIEDLDESEFEKILKNIKEEIQFNKTKM